jgi:hypothetical protein
MSSNISMKVSVISCWISSFRLFLWALLGSLALFVFVLLESGTGYLFSSFPSNLVLNYFGGDNGFHPFFFFPMLDLVLCNYVFDKLLVGFSHLFSFPWFNFVL